MDEEELLRLAESITASNESLEQVVQTAQRQYVQLKKQIPGLTTLSSPGPSSTQRQPPDTKLTITRYVDGDLRVYQAPNDAETSLESVATFDIQSNGEAVDCTVAPNLRRAAYASRNEVVCIDQDSTVLWSSDLEPHSTQLYGHHPSCAFSIDETKVWVYRPDAMAGRLGHDTLAVLDADTGNVVTKADLDTVGHGANITQHPDGQHILLGVGEGQDGAKIFRAALTSEGIELHSYGWTDRCLVDLASDGRQFMTVDHGRRDVAFHRFPDGEVVLRLSVADFEHQDGVAIDWTGGFLSPPVAVVTVLGEDDEEEWQHYHRVDLRTGLLMGHFEMNCPVGSDFMPLGDGSWIISRFQGDPVRIQDYP